MPDWTCHAHPAAKGGKPCGHVNRGAPRSREFHGRRLEYCEACGCTRIASDDRLARKREGRC